MCVGILILNLLFFVWITIYYPIYLTKYFKLSFFNPIIISFLFKSPTILFKTFVGPAFALQDGIFNVYFNYAIFMANIELIITLITTIWLLKTFHRRHLDRVVLAYITPKWHISPMRMKRVSLFFALLFLLCFIFVASHSYGLINWLISPRTGYQFHRSGVGQYYALALLFLSTSFALRLIYTRRIKQIFKWAFFYLFVVWFMGSKGFMLSFGCFTIIILWFRKYSKINRTIWLGIPAIFCLLLMNFGSINIEDISSYFDYYVNSALYYEEYFSGRIKLFHGEIMLSDLWGMVPRGIYPDKPYVYGFLLVNEHFWPGLTEATHTPAFGGPIKAFADFGVLGVVLSSIFNFSDWFMVFNYFMIFNASSFKKIKENPVLIYLMLIAFAPCFMFFIDFPISLIIFLLLAWIINISNRIIWGNRKEQLTTKLN